MRRLPTVVVVLCLAAIGIALLIPPTAYSERAIVLFFSLFTVPYVVVGGLVATRRPANRVGWLMLTIGAVLSAPIGLGAYAGYALLADPSWPWGLGAAWVTSWMYLPAFCLIIVLMLVFPQGRLLGRFRIWAARALAVAGMSATVALALRPGPIEGFGPVTNPLGVSPLADSLRVLLAASAVVLVGVFCAALGSIFVRLRRAAGQERQQLKWAAYAAALILVAELPAALPLGLDDSLFGLVSIVVALAALPTAIAVAILRHRLYDIDVVIKRTLVYGSLTVLLVATYLGLVLTFRLLLTPVVGESDLAVAASTLAVAALFRPARSRIQAVVDRRFFRRRYDASRTIEEFSGRLRQEVDLEAVTADLGSVVSDTMQPTHVSLWLRASP